MSLTRVEREELKSLSKEVFGVSSKYQRFLDGVDEVITQEVEEEVPGENGAEPTKRLVRVPVLFNGSKQIRIKRYTVEEVRTMLLDFKAKRDEIMATHRKAQEEAKAQQEQEALAKKIQQEAGGSSST